tara:strand:- start:446 stop:808 length:363 start_codon:yes stop_codon:yes gene_type:complete
MKKLLVITLLFLSSTIYSQSILSWFNPVEEYSCSCESILNKKNFKSISCRGIKDALVFQEGRRLELSMEVTKGKVSLAFEPSIWWVKKRDGGHITFDSITKEMTNSTNLTLTTYNCRKVN